MIDATLITNINAPDEKRNYDNDDAVSWFK